MSKEVKEKEKGRLSKMYGNFIQMPYVWYKLCRKYEIPKEVAELKNKGNTIEINPMEVNVLAYLAGYDECYPTNKQLSELFQVGISTIEKYLKELRWVGFIKTYEEKSSHIYTDRRNIYIQFDVINAVLKSEDNPYKCMVPSTCNPYDYMDQPIQMYGSTHIDEGIDPYMLATNNKELENIIKNNKENAEDKSSATASDEAKQIKTEIDTKEYKALHQSFQIDLNIYANISEQDVRNLDFNSKSHFDMFDNCDYIEFIYDRYIKCCDNKRNAYETISYIKNEMEQYNCDKNAIETCVGYFLYQHRLLKRSIEEIKIDFTKDELAS